MVYQEACRIFRHTTLLGYIAPWNVYVDGSRHFVTLTEAHIAKKLEALACYESQRERVYMRKQYQRDLASVVGERIGAAFAEAFEVIRWIE